MHVAVSLKSMNHCIRHVYRCGSQVDARGLHAFVCKFAPGKFARHQSINNVISRAFASAQVPATKEPTGLSRSDGRRPDGMTLIPWQNGKDQMCPTVSWPKNLRVGLGVGIPMLSCLDACIKYFRLHIGLYGRCLTFPAFPFNVQS